MNIKQGIIVVVLLIFVVGFGLLIAHFSDDGLNFQEHSSKVAVTIYPLYDIVQNIAGDTLEVALILPPGASPHFYEFSPRQLTRLQQTRVIFAIGYGIDDWLGDISNALPHAEIEQVDSGITLRKTDEGSIDPHYWLNFPNAEIIAENVALRLSILHPEFSEVYRQNLEQYLITLRIAEEETQAILAPYGGEHIITLHDAWEYFADNFQLTILGTFESEAGAEPTPQYLSSLQKAIKDYSITLIFAESQFSNTSVENFAKSNGIGIALLDPLGGVFGRESFIELMRYNAQTIFDAFLAREGQE